MHARVVLSRYAGGECNHSRVSLTPVNSFFRSAALIRFAVYSNKFFFIADEDIASSPEHARSTKDPVAPAKDPMTDAFSLLSKHLNNALEQQKNEIVSVLETKIPALNSSNTSKTEFKFKYTSNQQQCAFTIKCLGTFLLFKLLLWQTIGS